MKKISIVIIAILLLTTLTLSVCAAELSISVETDETTVHRGQTVTVTVAVDEKFTCRSGLLSIGFDTSIFTRSDNEWLLKDLTYSEPNGDASFILSDTKEISGKVYQFNLKVADQAAYGSYPINVTLILRDASGNSSTKTQKLTLNVECNHEYDKGTVTKEATCTEDGTKLRKCTLCGKERTDKITKLGHKYDDGVVETAPTCTEKGKKVFTCTRCKATKSEKIDAIGHSYDGDCDENCNTCGENRVVEHNYGEDWLSDERGHWHGCIDCGHVLELFPHNPGPEATETTEQLCLDCGFVIQGRKPHEHVSVGDWLGDDNNHWNQCACGEKIDVEAHAWNAGDVNETTQQVTYHCTVCGYAKTEALPTEPPAEPTETAPNQPGGQSAGETHVWMIVSLVLAILLVASWIYIILGIIGGKKRGGKFSS